MSSKNGKTCKSRKISSKLHIVFTSRTINALIRGESCPEWSCQFPQFRVSFERQAALITKEPLKPPVSFWACRKNSPYLTRIGSGIIC